jgi:hypothetical protein
VLDLFGGYLADGREISASTVPQFANGQRALVFLRNTSWSLSPVVGLLSFDIRSTSGADLVFHGDNAVVGINDVGIQIQSTKPPADSNDDEKLRDADPIMPRAITVNRLIERILAYANSIDIIIQGRYDATPTLPCKTWDVAPTIAGDRGAVRSPSAAREDERTRACLAAKAAAYPGDTDSDERNACWPSGGEK